MKDASKSGAFFCFIPCPCDEGIYIKEYNGEEGANGAGGTTADTCLAAGLYSLINCRIRHLQETLSKIFYKFVANKFANEKNNTYICIKKRDKKMSKHDYTVEQLEKIVFNQSRCYSDSEAFQTCLDFIKDANYPLYKDVLYKEAIECGGLN